MEVPWSFLKIKRPCFEKELKAVQKGDRRILSQDEGGNTLLHLAVLDNHSEHLQDLLAYGLSPQTKNLRDLSPLDLARFLGRTNFITHFEKKERQPINIFRNSDKKNHLIPLEEFEEKLSITYLDYLEFETAEMLQWVASRSQKNIQKTQFRQMNRWVLALHEKSILNPRHDYIYVRYINSCLGYGVFAARDIPALTYIGEYTGVVKKRKRREFRFNDYIFGYMVGPKGSPFLIDAKEKGNFTRFINHSDEPNLASRWVVIGGITRIILFSSQMIRKNTQLTYDYGKYYWRSRSSPELL